MKYYTYNGKICNEPTSIEILPYKESMCAICGKYILQNGEQIIIQFSQLYPMYETEIKIIDGISYETREIEYEFNKLINAIGNKEEMFIFMPEPEELPF